MLYLQTLVTTLQAAICIFASHMHSLVSQKPCQSGHAIHPVLGKGVHGLVHETSPQATPMHVFKPKPSPYSACNIKNMRVAWPAWGQGYH